MKEFIAFTKKEYVEQLRTYKWLIMLALFFVIGMMSPLLAKLMPDIFSGMDVQGIKLTIPEATIMDAYQQFFKNMAQLGIIVLLLIFGGTISNELVKGTLINILAKGMPRSAVILSKYTAAVTLWTVGYCLSTLTDYGYTALLFKNAKVNNLIFSLFCFWLFGCFVIALIFMSSTLTTGSFGGLILSVAVLAVLLLVSSLSKLTKVNPITLASKNLDLLNKTQTPGDLLITVLVTCIATVGCLYVSILLFQKKNL